MARDGYKVFDSDTHVGPYMEVLEKYLSAGDKTRLAGWDQYNERPRVPATPGRAASRAAPLSHDGPSRPAPRRAGG